METYYKAKVVFGDITTEAMSMDRFTAVLTAFGQAMSDHTIAEYKRGYGCSMPCIASFRDEEQLKAYLKEMNEDDEPWCEYTVDEISV